MLVWTKTAKPIKTSNDALGQLSLSGAEVPQVQTWEDAVSFHGGESDAIAFHNAALETSARNGARQKLTTAKAGTDIATLYKEAAQVAHDYSSRGAAAAGPTGKQAKANIDAAKALVESGETFSREKLLEILNARS